MAGSDIMIRAIAMVEYSTVPTGIEAADTLVKTANIEIIEAKVVCPGKYIVIITGDLSAIMAAVDAAKSKFTEKLVDSFVLGNIHEEVLSAIYGTVEVEKPHAMGVIETSTVASAIVAADTAAKSADVTLVELRLAKSMAGKSYLIITGDVACVSAAIENARVAAEDKGMFLDSSVIPNPDPEVWKKVL